MDGECAAILKYVEQTTGEQGSHGTDHVRRVFFLCETIGVRENADLSVLLPAALLHDVARKAEEERGIRHEEEGARVAGAYLSSLGFGEERIRQIQHAIRSHRFRSGPRPETPEARILSDADKLDAMGATGIARTFIRAGEHGGGIRDAMDHMEEKLLNLRDHLYTRTARNMAEERHRFLREFLYALRKETVS